MGHIGSALWCQACLNLDLTQSLYQITQRRRRGIRADPQYLLAVPKGALRQTDVYRLCLDSVSCSHQLLASGCSDMTEKDQRKMQVFRRDKCTLVEGNLPLQCHQIAAALLSWG